MMHCVTHWSHRNEQRRRNEHGCVKSFSSMLTFSKQHGHVFFFPTIVLCCWRILIRWRPHGDDLPSSKTVLVKRMAADDFDDVRIASFLRIVGANRVKQTTADRTHVAAQRTLRQIVGIVVVVTALRAISLSVRRQRTETERCGHLIAAQLCRISADQPVVQP